MCNLQFVTVPSCIVGSACRSAATCKPYIATQEFIPNRLSQTVHEDRYDRRGRPPCLPVRLWDGRWAGNSTTLFASEERATAMETLREGKTSLLITPTDHDNPISTAERTHDTAVVVDVR